MVSGRKQGAVCFSATSGMLDKILGLLKDEKGKDEARRDLVGEIANTLSGNVREEFGSDFHISVPWDRTGDGGQFSVPAEGPDLRDTAQLEGPDGLFIDLLTHSCGSEWRNF